MPTISLLKEERFLLVLVLILLMIVAIPFLREFLRLRLLLDVFFTAILLTAIWAIAASKARKVFALALALPYLAATWMAYAVDHRSLLLAGDVAGILFFGFLLKQILTHVLKAGRVSRDSIFAAVVSYFLLGIIWAFGYSCLELLTPGAFRFPAGELGETKYGLLYFSYVTISTLGYGDITPLTSKAASLAIAEALTGQIYLVVLVAWLVGMHVAHRTR